MTLYWFSEDRKFAFGAVAMFSGKVDLFDCVPVLAGWPSELVWLPGYVCGILKEPLVLA